MLKLGGKLFRDVFSSFGVYSDNATSIPTNLKRRVLDTTDDTTTYVINPDRFRSASL